MQRALNHLDSGLTALMRLATGVSFLVLMVAVMVQVIGRSLIGSSPGLDRGTDAVRAAVPDRVRRRAVAEVGCAGQCRSGVGIAAGPRPLGVPPAGRAGDPCLCALLLGPAWRYVSIGVRQTSPALGVRMDWIHLSVFVLLAGLLVFAALRIVRMLAGTSDGLPEPAGEVEE
jgi:TRAP-type transport system small permease protein